MHGKSKTIACFSGKSQFRFDMKRLSFSASDFFSELDQFSRNTSVSEELEANVRLLIADVEKRGDEAVSDCIARFDGATLDAAEFRISPGDLSEALSQLALEKRKAISESIEAVKEFGRRTIPQDWKMKNLHGATVGERFYPYRRVGVYVPGGNVPLVSTVVMTAGLATIAEVPEVVVFTPSNAEGEVATEILAACELLGIGEVYRIGGVQAIAAMAFGTETIPAVDKIFGPGNAYVVEAKRQLFGRVGIDLLPGPSELMVIAGAEANPVFVAADLLSQAEHGVHGRIYAVGSDAMLDRVEEELKEQVKSLRHAEILRDALENGYVGVEIDQIEEAIEVANFVAPEHLELHVGGEDRAICLSKITTAGSILCGDFSPTVLGDFVAGPSHVLPTGRSGRFSSGLRAGDFFRKSSLVEYDEESLKKALPTIEVFSKMEALDAHGRSAAIRFDNE